MDLHKIKLPCMSHFHKLLVIYRPQHLLQPHKHLLAMRHPLKIQV